ncbi:TD and POZ domain-containing protein 1-like isoform X2 [Neocloeon triangulifer]|uniref:TD and POZ domain-containing protein 1-like isoform X2 n=1 Tax=Neocloeon triangulifer TaxID=2078957 RepID=UPI00286EDD34|nr:TD and POZ domain-containing protein 1-like isoform X2 [Neocloeon triangulifer]
MNNFGMAGRGPDNVDLGYVIYSPAQNCYRYSMNVENMNNGDYIRALRPPVLPFRPEERNEEEKEPKHMLDASLVDESSNLFESSAMYDCSFRVRNKSSERVVRCHKFILCISSKVFQAMFRGDFSEAGKGPADEILIDDTNPDVFEEAMRFVYTFGQKKSFENIPKTAEMYVFADKWQFTSLKEAADSFLISMKLTLENVAFMYGIFKMINHKVGMQNCMRMILANTLNFLESEQWKTASLDLVDAVLIQDYLSIASECDLLKGLIEWGAANVPPTELNENGQPTDSQILKALP